MLKGNRPTHRPRKRLPRARAGAKEQKAECRNEEQQLAPHGFPRGGRKMVRRAGCVPVRGVRLRRRGRRLRGLPVQKTPLAGVRPLTLSPSLAPSGSGVRPESHFHERVGAPSRAPVNWPRARPHTGNS